jgi:Uma2 family endonuclease
MPSLTIELPAQADQTAFNLRRWADLLENPEVAGIEGRIETDRHGQIIMSPPPAPRHGLFQSKISFLLQTLMPESSVLTECPISTADGVRAADAACASKAVMAELGNRVCFIKAPEICVEIMSPENSERQIREKAALYFDAGAKEVWICDKTGAMRFLAGAEMPPMKESALCPLFPTQIQVL